VRAGKPWKTREPAMPLCTTSQGHEPNSSRLFAEQSIEIVGCPCSELTAELDGFRIPRGSDKIEREVPYHGHVPGPESFAQTGLVIVESDVQNPMQAVLDPPMAADGLTGALRIELRRSDVVSGFRVWPADPLDTRLDTNDAGDAGQAQFAGEAAISGQPVDLAHDTDGALFDTAMAFVVRGVGVECAGRKGIKAGLDLGAQGRLVGFDRQQVIGAGLLDGGCDCPVGRDGVDGNQRAAEPVLFGEPNQQDRNGGQFVGFVPDGFLAQYQAGCGGEGRNQVNGLAPKARSWLRREVLPSMATKSGRLGLVPRTQAVKAAENSAGLMRFIRMVSQRPPGTPCW
jgi:hypothetical protein